MEYTFNMMLDADSIKFDWVHLDEMKVDGV